MKKRKKSSRKKYRRGSLSSDIGELTGAGIGIGVGSAVVAGAGGSAAGLSAMGGMMPVLGTTMMGGHVLRGVRRLTPKKKKKRRR